MASDAVALQRAYSKYGPTLDHIAGQYTNPVTGAKLSGAALLAKLVQGESGGRRVVSSAGARSFAQFMPSSRAAVISKYGVDPWGSPDQAVHAASLHLRGHVNGQTGLEGYNPGGGQDYVNYILGQHVGSVAGGHGDPAASTVVGRAGGAFSPGAPAPVGTDQPTEQPTLQSVGLTPPAASAAPVLPVGYRPVQTGGVQAPVAAPAAPVAQGQSLPTLAKAASPAAAAGGSTSRSAARAGGGGFDPVGGAGGKFIGVPNQGTHTLGDWQSDNAVDIPAPVGTPMVAVHSGVVVRVRKHPQGSGRFAGDQVTIRGVNGNSYFYAHGSASVKAGDRVRAGDVIGKTGSANGVAHLHIGVEHGDPTKLFSR